MVLFEYGNSDNKEGYWSYENLVIKMEYYLDCLKFLYPSFDIIFIFEHLCGYDLTREDRLKTSIMRNYFGGKEPSMIDTVILWGVDFLYHMIVFWKTDDTQHMWWDTALTDI